MIHQPPFAAGATQRESDAYRGDVVGHNEKQYSRLINNHKQIIEN